MKKIIIFAVALLLAITSTGSVLAKTLDTPGKPPLSGAVTQDWMKLENPTFDEMRTFLLDDLTSRNEFILNEYECRHFATEVNNNAEAAGIRCAFILLCYRVGQHAVVAFETTDRGLVYIEPQTDAAIHPLVGGIYQGQEIIEILICW